ncbi:AMP-binding protein [Streptomyces sp. NPDC085866]|uniref:AMP-binding protein n=1 Tax=Streptomyces sp. NPDC085866 TaxID=3365736 RepID=UPI0037CE2636
MTIRPVSAGIQHAGNLLETAARQAGEHGVRFLSADPAPGERGREQTYPELLGQALRLLGALREAGVVPGRAVALLLEDAEALLPALWACLLGGHPVCPLAAVTGDPERWAAQLTHVAGLLDGPLLITDERTRGTLPDVPGLAVTAIEDLGRVAAPIDPAAVRPHPSTRADTALLMLTSGSTGASKAVELTHGNLLASLAAKAEARSLTAADTTLNWISYDHVGALLETHMLSVRAGARQLQVPPAALLTDPLRFLELIDAHRVTSTFAPNFLLGLINKALDQPDRARDLDLSCLRHIITGGEANPVATGVTFLDRLAPYGLRRDVLWPAFGMTETCAGSIYHREFPRADLGAEFAAVGRPVTGMEVRIAAGDGDAAAEPGALGEVQVRGPMVTRGYRNNPEATAAALTDDGWFRTGDLGRLDEGRLSLVGRSKDCVIVNGVNYFSHDLETVLDEVEGVARSFVAAFPTRPRGSDTEQLVVAFAPAPGTASDDNALYRTLVAVRNSVVLHWGFRPALLLPLPEEAFPKTSLGKIQRSLMRRRLEEGAYDDHRKSTEELITRQLGGHVAPEGPTERLLAELYAELFETDPESISATAGFFDLGGTSLDTLRLKNLVEQRLPGTELPLISLFTAPTVRDLAARIEGTRDAGQSGYDPVVPLQTSGTGTPLFCIHPGGGEVLVFVNLAKYFVHERPFYALRARGFDGTAEPFGSWKEMTRCYTEAIRRRQPHGPYAVAGYSFGAAAAFEVAKQLEAEGERVDFVGSFDLSPHIVGMDRFDHAETAANLAMFLGLISRQQLDGLPERLRPLPKEEQHALILDISDARRVTELDVDLEKLTSWMDLAHSLTELARVHRPSGRVGSVTVLYATPLHGSKDEWLHKHLRKWDDFTRGENTYAEVPGEHHTMLDPQHIGAFQAVLRAELNRALSEG